MTERGNMASVMESLSFVFQSVAWKIFWVCVCSTFRVCIKKRNFYLYYVAVYIIVMSILLVAGC